MAPPRNTRDDESDTDIAEVPSLAHPHDGLFRYAFGRPEHAAGELAFVLGDEVARLVLLLLQRARTSPDLVSDLAGFVAEMRALARTDGGRRDLRVAFR